MDSVSGEEEQNLDKSFARSGGESFLNCSSVIVRSSSRFLSKSRGLREKDSSSWYSPNNSLVGA